MVFIAIWNCTASKLWSGRGFNARLNFLRNAVPVAATEAVGRAGGLPWIFAAPEYAFSNANSEEAKAAVQVSTGLERDLINAARALSGTNQTMVLAPGTVPVVEGSRPERWARNTSYGFFNGAQVWRVDKRKGVGEVSQEELIHRYMVFRSGVGYATATIAGTTYGIEICADACNAGTLPVHVQRHLILASGADVKHTHDMSTELKIIADVGGFGVYKQRQAIEPYGEADVEDTKMYYFVG